jgi:hypothetical protein
MIGLGIQTEKIELLRGNATERIEHVDVTPAADEFDRWLKHGAIDAESHETGLPDGECGTKGERVQAGLLAPAPHALGDPAPASSPGVSAPGDTHEALHNIGDVGITHDIANVSNGFENGYVSFDVSSQSLTGDQASGNDPGAHTEPAPTHMPDPTQTDRGGGGQVLPPTQHGAMNE